MSEACEMERLSELKNQAQTYYSGCGPGGGVVERVEQILNYTFYKQPSDIYGYITTYFDQFCAPPSIAKIIVEEVPDCRGRPTVQATVYCLFKNDIKLTSSAVAVYTRDYELKLAAGYSREEQLRERERDVEEAMRLVDAFSNELLRGLPVTQQCHVDHLITKFFKQMQTDAEAEAQAAAEAAAAVTAAAAAAASVVVDKSKEEKPGERGGGSAKSKKSSKQQEESKKKGKEEAASSSASPKAAGSKAKAGAGGGSSMSKMKPTLDVSLFIPEEMFESFYPGSIAVSAVSQAVCRAAASVAAQQRPLYEYISHLHISSTQQQQQQQSCGVEFGMPVPIFTIMVGGRRLGGGKLKSVKEFLLIPSPHIHLTEAVRVVNKVYNYCSTELNKRGAHAVSDEGVLSPVLERVEEVLDLISQALTLLNLTLGTHFHLALNCSSHEIYIPAQEKYEISAGRLVTSSELVSYWSDLLQAYPSIIALVDPLRRADEEAWMTLYRTVYTRCYLIADYVYGRPHTLYCDIISSGISKLKHLHSPNSTTENLPPGSSPTEKHKCGNIKFENLKCGNEVAENFSRGNSGLENRTNNNSREEICTNQKSGEEICTNQNAKTRKTKPEKAPGKEQKKEESPREGNPAGESPGSGSEVEERRSVVCRLVSQVATLRLEHCETLTHLIHCYQLLTEQCMDAVVGLGSEHTPDGFLADLAVGLGAKFLWLGCVSKGNSCQTVARLLQIESQLRTEGRLVEACSQFQFDHTRTISEELEQPPSSSSQESGQKPKAKSERKKPEG